MSIEFNCLHSEEGIVIPENILDNKIALSFCYRYIQDSSRTYEVRLVQGHSWPKLGSLRQKGVPLESRLVCSKLKNKLVTNRSSISWAQYALNYLDVYTTV